jgi:hypothetical protein
VPSSRDASSSDLTRARERSLRLGQPQAGAEAAAPARDPSIPRFTASQVRGVPAPTAQPPIAGPVPAPAPARLPPVPTAGGFDARAAWCREALSADAAFLIDERGLLVASVGSVPAPEAEGMGARLVFTFDQADAMRRGSDRARAITVEFGSSWLTGWRFPLEGIVLTLGIVSPRPLAPGAAALVARAFASGRR